MSVPSNPSAFRRYGRFLGSATLTLGVIALSAGAIVFSVGLLNDRASAVPQPEAAPAVPVSAVPIVMEDGYTLPRRFVGQVEARSTVSLSFELNGKLVALPVDEGDLVAEGQVIARLDTELLEAEVARLTATRAAAKAQLVFAQARLTRAEQLQQQGFTSTETLDQALAARDELVNRIAQTDAALTAVEINISKSTLYAPFAGQIAAQSADMAETISAGQQIVSVVETSAPEFRVGLPLDIPAKALGEATVEIGDRLVQARLKRLRPDIDPVTRTRTALFALPKDTPVVFGQTAALLFETTVNQPGAWVAVDALKSGEGSVWTLLVVRDGVLDTAAVEILHIDGDRAYVRGTFEEGMQIVAQGAHRVVAGQTVSVLPQGN